jgi:glycosyltransferase involved in cell wall biosynthesis
VRILLVSNMYPSARRPDHGIFVAAMADALGRRGHDVDLAVLREPRAGRVRTPAKYAVLLARGVAGARRRPDVVYAHFLFPPGGVAALAALAARRPYVVTAHGTDVANVRRSRALALATRASLARAAAVVPVSNYLAERLAPVVPAGARLAVISSGVDRRRFMPAPRTPGPGPRFLFVGSLTPRKNVARLLAAFATLPDGSLTVVGDGPLAPALRATAPPGVRFAGTMPPAQVAEELRRHDVLCLPSLVEPLGQAAMEALATARPVVATRVGGPAEYVTPACGALVDPLDVPDIARGMRDAAALPVPCDAAVAVAGEHDLDRQAARVEAVLAAAVARRRGAR